MSDQPRNGGAAARLAIARWAWRSFRREWKQQALVIALLGIAMATGVGLQALLYNTTGVREQARFGTANHRYEVAASDAQAVLDATRVARDRFGQVDLIGQWTAALPGSVDTVDFLAQDPAGPHGAPMLALVDGRYPAAVAEAALTDGLAATLGLDIGETIDLDGVTRRVVGIVENPSDLQRDFVLTAPSEFDRMQTAALLIDGSGGYDEVPSIRAFGSDHLPEAELSSQGDRANARAAASVLAGTQVVLLLVGLVASAGFAAVAQRRLRQLGLLGAVGASQRHVTLVVLASGAAVGVVAATVGAVVGVGAWLVAAQAMEESVGYRIDSGNLPWPLLALTFATTIGAATAAAWLPARASARVPIVQALARRPSPPPPAARSGALGVGLAVAGAVMLALFASSQPVFLILGTVCSVIGVLLLAPALTNGLGAVAGWFPVAVRIALRDLARYRSRSALALAAVSLALGLPVAVVVLARSSEAADELANLPPESALMWTKDASQPDGVSPFYTVDRSDEGFAPYLPDLSPDDLDRLGHIVDDAARDLDASVVPLEWSSIQECATTRSAGLP